MIMLPRGVEPALGRALLALFGDDARRVRGMAQRDCEHFLCRRHFEIERPVRRGLDAREVVVADMAPVLAQMRGDSVAADRGDAPGRPPRLGVPPPPPGPGLPDLVE